MKNFIHPSRISNLKSHILGVTSFNGERILRALVPPVIVSVDAPNRRDKQLEKRSAHINLGAGCGTSVLKLTCTAENVSAKLCPMQLAEHRPSAYQYLNMDLAVSAALNSLAGKWRSSHP